MIVTQYAIDTNEYIMLGGKKQNIRILTRDENAPVLLFLHGGPGVCDRQWVIKDQSGLTDTVTMVCWDQRCSGLSYDKKYTDDELHLPLFVSDAHELVDYLRKRFHKDKIYIVGHSWGSLLGTLLAAEYPEGIAAYIGMGQFVNGAENELLSYQFVVDKAKESKNKKALKQLAEIGAPVEGHYKSRKDLMVQRNWMTKFGGGCYKEKEDIVSSVLLPLLKSPEYRLRDLWGYYKGTFRVLDAFWNEVVDRDLFTEVTALKVPVFLTEGRHDWNTPVSIAQRWFDALDAPRKEWIWFEESAHSPIKEEPQAWQDAVRGIIRSCEG